MTRCLRPIPPLAALLLVCSLASAPTAAGQTEKTSPIREQDRTVYDTLYKDKLTSAKRTRTINDDLTLAREMLAFAKDIPDDTGVLCLAYADTITLASNASELGLMREAYTLLTTLWPEQDAISPEQLMQQSSRAYRGVDREDRQQQGEHYIHLLLSIADQYENQNDPDQSLSVFRLANTVARTIGSPLADPINERIQLLNETIEIDRRIKILKTAVEKDPGNSAAAKNLVTLLITRHNDPATAMVYVNLTEDKELIDLVIHSARGIGEANAATAMRIADWHLALADDEPEKVALKLLEQARQWYARFKEQYNREDALAKRVEEMDRLALAKIDQIIVDQPDLAGAAADGWASLIEPPYDPDDYKTDEAEFERDEQGGLTFDGGKFFVPYEEARAYEIKLTLTVHEDAQDNEDPAIRIYLPLNNRVLATRYYIGGERIANVDEVDETHYISPAPGRVGQKCELTLQIVMDDEHLAFAMLYNSKPAVKWQGELKKLNKYDREWLEEQEIDNVDHAMYLSCPAHLTLHALEFKSRE